LPAKVFFAFSNVAFGQREMLQYPCAIQFIHP
jgi:hypothetical protein